MSKPLSAQESGPLPEGYEPHPLTWMLGSLLFFFIVVVVGPGIWEALEKPGGAPTHSAANRALAWMGLIAYFTEPLIWHYALLLNARKISATSSLTLQRMKTADRNGWEKLFNLATALFWALPTAVFFIFKPVLRALLLFLSLSFLGDVQAPGNNWKGFFNIVVALDIFFYYLCRLAPNWKYNPINILLRIVVIRSSRPARLIADLLLILHTALISSLLLTLMYAGYRLEGHDTSLRTLSGWWLALTLYNRLSLNPGREDENVELRTIRREALVLDILQLGISFLAFIWPFYFGSN